MEIEEMLCCFVPLACLIVVVLHYVYICGLCMQLAFLISIVSDHRLHG
jgi:hypothetical protein